MTSPFGTARHPASLSRADRWRQARPSCSGIGLNVNQSREDFPPDLREIATSLRARRAHRLDRLATAAWLLHSLESWYRDFRSGDYGRIARHWRRLSSTLGRRVMLLENGREYRGRVLDFSLEDGLIVRLDQGMTRVFNSVAVTLRQLPE